MKNVIFVLVLTVLAGCSTQRGFPPEHGILNFDHFDKKVYRGAQPSQNGLQYLSELGVKTIINLREPGDSAPYEPLNCARLGVGYINVPMNGMSAPTVEQIRKVIQAIDLSPGPVFIHCEHGCDRTGTACACWRIVREGWPNDRALAEAVIYGMSPFETGMKRFILGYR
jgi:protein tyrosine/serine phosphatase